MSRRAHYGLRLSGLLLLLAVAAWPSSRAEHHDRGRTSVATPAHHLFMTTAARLDHDQPPRPRAVKQDVLAPSRGSQGEDAPENSVELSSLTN